MLQRELDAAHAREEAAREREALLFQMLQQLQQQNQRLLDMPRSAPVPASPSLRAPAAHEASRGDMRRRIVTLLQEHPEGLTAAEMRTLLGVEKSLADTCLGMLRYGLVQRVGRGRYVAVKSSRNDR